METMTTKETESTIDPRPGWRRRQDYGLARTALDVALEHIQKALGETDGQFAAEWFSHADADSDIIDDLLDYIQAERRHLAQQER
jgi:hypothetical protein